MFAPWRPIAFALVLLAGASRALAQCPTADRAAAPQQPVNINVTTPTITYSWTAATAAGVTGYQVLIAPFGTNTFTTACSAGAAGTSCNATAPATSGTYWWFVRALVPGCAPGLDSARKAFAVGCPGAPTIISPIDNATGVANPPTLRWTTVTGAERYEIYLGAPGAGCTAASAIATSTSNSFTPPALQPNTTYEWKVEAKKSSCPSAGSSCVRFTTAAAAPPCPIAPTLSLPAENAAIAPGDITLSWQAAANATAYEVFGGQNGAAAVSIGRTTATSIRFAVAEGTRVAWFVRAFATGCTPVDSAQRIFTTTRTCNTTAPILQAPANGATGVSSPVEFRWSAVAGAIAYRLFVSLNGATPEQVASTTDTSLTRIVSEGVTDWFVEAVFIGCPQQRSSTFRFTVPAATCPTGSVTLVSPPSGATVSAPVNFSWNAVTGATAYRVWISVDGSTPIVGAVTTTPNASIAVSSGVVDWSVEAIITRCPSLVSARSRFTVARAANCDANTPPALVAPLGGTTASPVTFSWQATNGASAYVLWISKDGQPFDDIGITAQTTLQRELPAGRYDWYVEAGFAGCARLSSARASFNISSAACSNSAPALIGPAEGSLNVLSPVTFSWTPVANAVAYRLFGSQNGNDFLLLGTTTATMLEKAVPPGPVFWYVQAVFSACRATDSAHGRFTVAQSPACRNEKPRLTSPPNGATNVTTPVEFVWEPVLDAIGYHLWARANDGAATRIAETRQTSVTRALPATTLEWWIEAFVPGCLPIASDRFTFTIPLPEGCDDRRPLLLTPEDGATGVPTAVELTWTPLRNTRSYRVWVSANDSDFSLVGVTNEPKWSLTVPAAEIRWYVERVVTNCPPVVSATGEFTATTSPACRTPDSPRAIAPGRIVSGTTYGVRWRPVTNASSYEVQESSAADFRSATSQVVTGTSATFLHDATTSTRYWYRVRALSNCSTDRGGYSTVVSTLVIPTELAQKHGAAEVGSSSTVVQTIFVPGQSAAVPFTATVDKAWLSVTPASGTLPPEGIKLTVRSDAGALLLGTNTATVSVAAGNPNEGRYSTHAVTPTSVPVSVSLVTPVGPSTSNTPPPDSLFIPAVAHAQGANNSLFESDVRITNTSAQTLQYALNFVLSNTDGTQSAQSTQISVAPGATTALDEILTTFFGVTSESSASGTLEIRPLTTTSSATLGATAPSVTTVASSRTYNVTPTGTFGQFIPAIPYSQFISRPPSGSPKKVLSLQQIAQSEAYRTNFGLVEGSGAAADVLLSVFTNDNVKLAEIPITLLPSQHTQINGILAANNISLEDGRFEVEVTSATGSVTAYASVVNNQTNDPLLVSPVLKGASTATRFVVPGVAYINNGLADWRTDLRIFNSGTTSTPATVIFYPQGNPGSPQSADITLSPGEVRAIDNILPSLFNATSGAGGSVVVTTPTPASVVASARTYNQTSTGTYGQFVPGIRPDESVGSVDRVLQLLQLESSSRFRTNIGIVETTGAPATAEVSIVLPDSKFATKIQVPLAANEFVQLPLASFGVGTVYNARATVKVVSGTGKVTAYGSVIDMITQDPTYVPAQ